MPYLGQNLDKLGVIRVKPNWDTPPEKKSKLETPVLSRFPIQQKFFRLLEYTS